MNRTKTIGIVLAVLFLGGIAIWLSSFFSGSGTSVSEVSLGDAKKQELRISLLEEGTLRPYDFDKISIDTNQVSKFQIEDIASNGSQVNKGDVILRLDQSEVEKKMEETKLELESAKNNLLVTKEEKKKQLMNARMDIQKAKLELELARKNLEKYTNMEREKKRKEKEMAVKQARVKVDEKKSSVKAAKKMKKKGLISQAKLDRTQIELEDAQFQLEKALMEEKIYKKYTAPIKKTKLENKVKRKEKQLESRKSYLQAEKSQKQSDVKKAKSKLDNVKEKLQELKNDLDKLVVEAPSSGILNYGSPEGRRSDDTELKVGEEVRRGRTLMYIPDLSNMYVHVPVDEADISKLLATGEDQDQSTDDGTSIDLSEIDRKTLMSAFKNADRSEIKKLSSKIPLKEMHSAGSVDEAMDQLDEEQKQTLRSFLSKHLETRSGRFKRLNARITSESFPNAKITGTVDYVAGAASEESWWSDVKQFDTKIKLNEHYDWFRPGMNVKVDITVEKTKTVLTVPVDAIFSEEGELFCFRATNSGTFEKVFVRTDRSNGNYVEVTHGKLSEGDQVALARPEEARVVRDVPLPDEDRDRP